MREAEVSKLTALFDVLWSFTSRKLVEIWQRTVDYSVEYIYFRLDVFVFSDAQNERFKQVEHI